MSGCLCESKEVVTGRRILWTTSDVSNGLPTIDKQSVHSQAQKVAITREHLTGQILLINVILTYFIIGEYVVV